MTIKDFGTQVENVWAGLRPRTQKLIVGAMQSAQVNNSSLSNFNFNRSFLYDAHADWELCRLLKVLDERASQTEAHQSPQNLSEIRKMADVCARVLTTQTESAEAFIQLSTRALRRFDFAAIDKLADILNARYSAGEVAEIARQTELAAVRALAMESLAQFPTSRLIPLFDDPLYAEIAQNALEQQAIEYESTEARQLLEELAFEDMLGGE